MRRAWVTGGTVQGTEPLFAVGDGTPDYSVQQTDRLEGAALPDGRLVPSVTCGAPHVTDGTPAGTQALAGGLFVEAFAAFGGEVWFVGGGGQDARLWRTDGTPEGTRPQLLLSTPLPAGTRPVSAWKIVATYLSLLLAVAAGGFANGRALLFGSDEFPSGFTLLEQVDGALGIEFRGTFGARAALSVTGFGAGDFGLWTTDGTLAGTERVLNTGVL